MFLFVRLLRSLKLVVVIAAGYLFHLALRRTFARRELIPDGRRKRVLPPWLQAQREALDARNAKRLYRGFVTLRGVFIKLGQVLSIMGGFLPRVYAKELEGLQDQVPPHPYREIEKALVRSLKGPVASLFADFNQEPIAAASLGQVHAATLADGRKVAVKVLYPGIRAIIAVDMQVVRLALWLYKRFVPVAKLDRVHDSLVDMLGRETNYLHEAECLRTMSKNFRGENDIVFPEVVESHTTSEVLCMTFMEGVKITRFDTLAEHGVTPNKVATRLVQIFYKMLFVDHYFHADPHPGNFLIRPGASPGSFELVVLDFGAACTARAEVIDGLLEALQAMFAKNPAGVLRGFRRMGFMAEGGNEALLEATVERYVERLLRINTRTPRALMEASPDQLEALADPGLERAELQDLMKAFEYPEDWFYVERASVLLFWLAAQIDPDLDTMMVGVPYVMPLIVQKQMAAAAVTG